MRFDIFSKQFVDIELEPNKLAVVGSDQELTWMQFREQFEIARSILVEQQIPAGHPVIIYGHKEANFMVWETALTALSLPFIPFDSQYPTTRLNQIIEETESHVIINISGKSIEHKANFEIDNKFKIIIKNEEFDVNRLVSYGDVADPLLYMIFTSGSTGKPKGVMVNHSNYCELIKWMESDYGFYKDDVFMNQAVFSFDLSLYDCFFALHIGATLLTIDKELAKDSEQFLLHLKRYNCSVWTSTPSAAFIHFQNPLFSSNEIPSLRTFLFIGEALPERTVTTIEQKFKNCNIFNAYGPTEASVATTICKISSDEIADLQEVPIGKSKPDGRIELINIDENGVGEIVIVGNHVAMGYFKNEELTGAKFIEIDGERAFKTGDLACYKNNTLLFRGRNDDQIKLRGYRIELGEISSKLNTLSYIKHSETIALSRKNVVKKIVAFVELNESVENIRVKIADDLDGKLPDYMIPSDFRSIEEWPLNANLKIERKELQRLYLKR